MLEGNRSHLQMSKDRKYSHPKVAWKVNDLKIYLVGNKHKDIKCGNNGRKVYREAGNWLFVSLAEASKCLGESL